MLMTLPNISPGGLRDPDVVADRLAHLFYAVGPHQDRHRQDDLRGLAEVLLKIASHQQVEYLIGPPELHVGLERHRVIPLNEGVEELVDRDGLVVDEPGLEILPLQHPGHRHLGRYLHKAVYPQFLHPGGVERDDRLILIEDLEDLLFIGLRVYKQLLAASSARAWTTSPTDRRSSR